MAQENKEIIEICKIDISFNIRQSRSNIFVVAYKNREKLGYHIEKDRDKMLDLHYDNSNLIQEYDEKGDVVYYKHHPEFVNLTPFQIFESFLISFLEFVPYLLIPKDFYDKIEINQISVREIEEKCFLSVIYKIQGKNIHDVDKLREKIISFTTLPDENTLTFFAIFSCNNKQLIFDYLKDIKILSETKGEDPKKFENFLNMFRYLFYCDEDLINERDKDEKSTPCLSINTTPNDYQKTDPMHYFYPLKIFNIEFQGFKVESSNMAFRKKSKKKSSKLKSKSKKLKTKKVKSKKLKTKSKKKSGKPKAKSKKPKSKKPKSKKIKSKKIKSKKPKAKSKKKSGKKRN